MRTKDRLFYLTICILSTVVTSCLKKNNSESHLVQSETIKFDSIQVEKKAHLFDNENKPACKIEIDFIYPEDYSDSVVLKTIQGIFNTKTFGAGYGSLSPQEAVDNYISQYVTDYKEIEKDYEEQLKLFNLKDGPEIPIYSYQKTVGTSIPFSNENIISFIANSWEYTGGAHGAGITNANVIDVKTGKLLEEKDIFNDNTQGDITNLILKKLAENYEVSSPKDLVSAGFFNVEDIHPNNNFMADDKGITYIYNQYEIAPYSMGVIEVFLPYEEIGSFIKKDSPLIPFFNQ